MTQQSSSYNLPHWDLYRSIESDLDICFRYVHPRIAHDDVTSDEFAKIILVAASEFENVLNEFALALGCQCRNITEYYTCISAHYPAIISIEMGVPRFNRRFKPLSDWSVNSGPDWFKNGYNKIKHDRLSHPDAPTLKRALFAVASLELILFYFYKHTRGNIDIPISIEPKLIEPTPPHGQVWETASVCHGFELP